MMAEADPTHPYATAARLYADAGWAGVLPLPEKRKAPPPDDYTGRGGVDPSQAQIEQWIQRRGNGNIALRLPRGTIGIDVDDYSGKGGGDSLRQLEAEYGPLPLTLISTSRFDQVSGIRVFRLPYPAELNDKPGAGIEIIQHHHRFMVVWPSVHPDTGDPYRWLRDGEVLDRAPDLEAEAELLPESWFVGLQAPRRRLTSVTSDPPGPRRSRSAVYKTPAVERALEDALGGMNGGRHDAALHGCIALLRFDSLGYPGTEAALEELEEVFLDTVTADGTRSQREADSEWKRMVDGGLAVIENTPAAIRSYDELMAERDSEPIVVDHPSNQRRSIKDKLPEGKVSPAWDESPTPLGSRRADLPRFPLHVLPPWISTMATAVAAELQVPVDLSAQLALAALATVATGRTKVAINSSWEEHLNLYLVIIMPPGAGKSPAAKKMLRPVRDYEKELIASATPAAARYEQEQRMREKAMRKAEDSGDKVRAAELLLEQEMAEPITVPQLTVDDITPEELEVMLAENGGRAAFLSTEGGLFDVMASNRYNAGSAQYQLYLKGFSGDWHKSRRVSRGRTEIDEALITISLVAQPMVLEKLGAKPELAGVGLTARFMYSVPPDMVGWRDFINAPPLSREIEEEYRTALLNLARTLGLNSTPVRLRLTPEAADRFLRWHQDMEPRKRKQGDLRLVAEWSEKLRVCVVRLAGLLHLANGHDWDDIGLDTLERALEVAAYWLEHATAVHELWTSSPSSNTAQGFLDWLSEGRVESFTGRQAYKEGPLRNSAQAQEILALLEEHGWVQQVSGVWGKGGRSSPEFAVHPLVPQRATARHSSDSGPVASCGTAENGHRSEMNSQVSTGEDNEMTRDDVLCPSGSSGLKGISNQTLSLFTHTRTQEPPATADTGPQQPDDTAQTIEPYDPNARPDELW